LFRQPFVSTCQAFVTPLSSLVTPLSSLCQPFAKPKTIQASPTKNDPTQANPTPSRQNNTPKKDKFPFKLSNAKTTQHLEGGLGKIIKNLLSAFNGLGCSRDDRRHGVIGQTRHTLATMCMYSEIFMQAQEKALEVELSNPELESAVIVRKYDATPILTYFGALQEQLLPWARYLFKDEDTSNWRTIPLKEYKQKYRNTPKRAWSNFLLSMRPSTSGSAVELDRIGR